MDLDMFLAHLNKGLHVKGGSQMHKYMTRLAHEAMKITAELNGAYHSPEEIRELFSKLTGKQIDESFGLFPPFYTDCGKNITIGKDVFINSGCRFQDQGGITVENKPVVLVAMHGNSTASSIVEVADALVQDDNIYAFDLELEKDMQLVYEELKETILEINQGKGILMLYDMGSLQTMAEMIERETGVEIKSVCVPATLIALDASRKASTHDTLDEVYHDVMDSYQQVYSELAQSSRKQKNPQVIITLCMTGEGAAVQMKNYIEQNICLENTDIVPLAISDREYLLKKVNQIQKNQKIVCVVGAYDPELYGIPYIPISTLFDTPADKLGILLSLETVETVASVNYNAIYAYLQEQLEGFDILLLKEVLPSVIARIKKAAHGLSSNQEIGLFMHIACMIYRTQNQEEAPVNRQSSYIISKNKRLYNDLKDILASVEAEFYITVSDDEVANIIQIIRQC